MFKKTLLIILAGISLNVFADDAIQPNTQDNTNTQPILNTSTGEAKNSSPANSTDNSAFSQNNATEAKSSNSPNVNSRLYSGAQFPQQNDLTGEKGARYNQQKPQHQNNSMNSSFDRNNSTDANQANSPTVNPRLYSGAQFPGQNKLTGQKGVKYTKKPVNQNNSDHSAFNRNNATDANQANSPTVNSRLYSGAQFPQQNQLTKSKKKKTNNKQSTSQAQ